MTDELIKNHKTPGISASFETGAMNDLLEEASANSGRKNGFYTKKSFAPSGLGYGSGKCPRYWYQAFHGANFVYETTALQKANMDNGTAAGERIAKLFEASGILNSAEGKVISEDPPIFGYMDLAVTWQGEQMVGEVKTTREESWNVRAATMKPPGYQLLQLLIYMEVLKKDKGFFVIENKNTHQLLILPVKMTPENKKIVDYAFQWMRDIKANSDADLLPTRPYTKSSIECKSCPLTADCWPELENGKGYRNGGPNDPLPGVIDLPPLVVPR